MTSDIISEVEKTYSVRRRWYNSHTFPLVPTLEIRKASQYNVPSFSFKWLVFSLWSLNSVSLELQVVIDTHWGVGVIGILPYLRWVCCIPCPMKLQMWVQRNLWRKPKEDKNDDGSAANAAELN